MALIYSIRGYWITTSRLQNLKTEMAVNRSLFGYNAMAHTRSGVCHSTINLLEKSKIYGDKASAKHIYYLEQNVVICSSFHKSPSTCTWTNYPWGWERVTANMPDLGAAILA